MTDTTTTTDTFTLEPLPTWINADAFLGIDELRADCVSVAREIADLLATLVALRRMVADVHHRTDRLGEGFGCTDLGDSVEVWSLMAKVTAYEIVSELSVLAGALMTTEDMPGDDERDRLAERHHVPIDVFTCEGPARPAEVDPPRAAPGGAPRPSRAGLDGRGVIAARAARAVG
jgi:hypothetical protein